jgi:osmotically inducible lipoprotein OsmB
MRIFLIVPAIAATLAVAACGSTPEDRAISGAILGAAAGQAIGHDTGSTVGGAVIGGVAGAATAPD